MQLCSKIFQHLGHLFPLALLTSTIVFSCSDNIFSALDVIKYSAKSKLFNNSYFILFTFNFISASKLDPIYLEVLFASIAIFASCLILNSWSHLSFNFKFSQFFGTSTNENSWIFFSSLLIKLYISSVVKTKIGANHLSRLSNIILRIVTQFFHYLEFSLSQ